MIINAHFLKIACIFTFFVFLSYSLHSKDEVAAVDLQKKIEVTKKAPIIQIEPIVSKKTVKKDNPPTSLHPALKAVKNEIRITPKSKLEVVENISVTKPVGAPSVKESVHAQILPMLTLSQSASTSITTSPTPKEQPIQVLTTQVQTHVYVPLPSFGLIETAPRQPEDWESAIAGFYYIDENHPGATDTDNPYGSKLRPRRTIPGNESNPLPRGSVVLIKGKYTHSHTSPRDFHGLGTMSEPIFIRGENAQNKAYFTNTFDVVGSTYVIFENIEFGDKDGDLSGGEVGSFSVTDKNGKKYDSQHIVLRHSDVHGNLEGGATSIAGYGGSTFSNIVFYRNKIHDNGNWKSNFDQDIHGTQIGNGATNIWILENEYFHNSGDGVQINGKTVDSVSNIYISKNTAHHNKQVGFWTKKATNVIFSENTSYGHYPSDSSSGQGMGFQYDPRNVIFVKNTLYDNLHGIVGDRSEDSQYFTQNIKLIDNNSPIPYKAFTSN